MKELESYIDKTRRFVIFGTGAIAVQCVLWMENRELRPVFFVDNDTKKQGKTFLNIPVEKPDAGLLKNKNILIASTYYQEIKEQLLQAGLAENRDFFNANILLMESKMKQWKTYCELNEDSYYESGFYVDLRHPKEGKTFLYTGEHCVLSGRYVFETEEGEIHIGNRVHIGSSQLICRNRIVIEDDVTIAWDVLIYDHNSHSVWWDERQYDTEKEYQDLLTCNDPIRNKDWSVVKSAPIHICSKAWIGVGVKILKGVTIGEGAVIGAGSVVTGDIRPWTIAGGNPAVEVRRLKG